MDLIACGRLGRPHGVRGAIRVWPLNPATPLVKAGRSLQVGRDARKTRTLIVSTCHRDGKSWVMRFDGVDDRDVAAKLTGLTWYVQREAFAPAADDEVYLVDLIGLAVQTEAGDALGVIVDIWQAGAGDVLVIRGDRGDHLVPNVPDFVVRLDPANPPVIIRPIDGLLGEH